MRKVLPPKPGKSALGTRLEKYVNNSIAVKLQTLFSNTSTLIYINLNVDELQYRQYLVQDGVQANALKSIDTRKTRGIKRLFRTQ